MERTTLERELSFVASLTLAPLLIWQKSAVGKRLGLTLAGEDSDPQGNEILTCIFSRWIKSLD